MAISQYNNESHIYDKGNVSGLNCNVTEVQRRLKAIVIEERNT